MRRDEPWTDWADDDELGGEVEVDAVGGGRDEVDDVGGGEVLATLPTTSK